jgi:hypothetical protein
MKIVWTILVAVIFALVGKSIGRFRAKTHLTDDTSSILTVAALKASLKRVGHVAIGTFLGWLAMIALASFIARWIKVVGLIPLIAMNGCLALLAGTAATLGGLLSRPARWDALQAHIEQRERLIECLKRFLPLLLIVVLASFGSAHAEDNCYFGVDLSPSVNVADQHDARAFLKRTGADGARSLGCKHVVAVAMGCDVRFAKRVWLDVPADLPAIDCAKAEPEPLEGHNRFWDFIRGIADSRKEEAVARCEAEKEARTKKHEADVAAFAEALDAAFTTSEPQRCSPITASIRDALNSGLFRAIVVASDAVDNPPASLKGIVVHVGTRVVVILARPNPTYARVEASLARGAALARIPGFTVVTTAELRPDLWRATASDSRR